MFIGGSRSTLSLPTCIQSRNDCRRPNAIIFFVSWEIVSDKEFCLVFLTLPICRNGITETVLLADLLIKNVYKLVSIMKSTDTIRTVATKKTT